MALTVRRRPEVYYDVIEAAEYIERDSPAAALRFFDQVESTLQKLSEMPGKGAIRSFESPKLDGIRGGRLTGSRIT